MSFLLNLFRVFSRRGVRKLFCVTLAVSFLAVESEASAQVFGRMRSVPRSPQSSVPQRISGTTRDASQPNAQSHQNGYIPNVSAANKQESVPTKPSSVSSSQRDFSGFDNAVRGSISKGRNAGISAAVDAVPDSPDLTAKNDAGNSYPSLERAKSEKSDLPLLALSSGKYDFVTAVKVDEVNSYVANAQGLCVVVPHKNFVISQQSVEDGQDKKSAYHVVEGALPETSTQKTRDDSFDFAPSSDVSSVDSSFYEDYIVFTLTNLEPQEEQLLRDAVDGRWNEFDLLSASLIAEGLTTSESRMHYRSRFESLVASLLQQTKNMQDQLQKTERVYNFLHSRALFSKYNLSCSSVAASLDSGVFNCVSATVLFNCLASRAGLNVAALETTGHAKSRVKFEDSFLDIETTCSTWNKLPDRMRPYQVPHVRENVATVNGTPDGIPEKSASVSSNESVSENDKVAFNFVSLRASSGDTVKEEGSTTFQVDSDAPLGYSFTRSRRPMREITDVELVATIYYNVGVDYSQAGDYERSIASYIKAVQLAPGNKTILGNLKATLNNWAIDVAMKEKDYEKAICLTELGQRIDPDFREFKMNMPIFFRDWIDRLSKENDWEAVKRVQEEYLRRFPK